MSRSPAGARAAPRPRRGVAPVVENMAESTTACLLAMVQGNVVVLTASHWAIAAQTGLAAGALASAALVLSRVRRPWVVALVLGGTTAVVDGAVHDGGFGPPGTEALVTGLVAGILSWIVGSLVARARAARARRRGSAAGV